MYNMMSKDLEMFIEDLGIMIACKKIRNEGNENYCNALKWVENQIKYLKKEYEEEDEDEA